MRAFISIWSIRKVQVEKTNVSVTLNGTNDFVFIEILLIIPAHKPEGLTFPPTPGSRMASSCLVLVLRKIEK